MALLEVSNLGIAFGGLQAVDKVDLTVEEGALCGLIGPNGAGKTTVFNMLTGVYSPTEGDIILNGKNITGQSPASICKAGIARTFQNIRLFKAMTVLDNVKVGLHNQIRYNALTGIFRLPAYYEKEREMKGRAMSLLKIFGLDEEAKQPAAGMNPNETAELMETIKFVREKFGVAILLIEHDMSFVMGLCEHIVVLNYGRILAQGDPETVRNDPKVIAAYLGGE